jgi:pimeloyl-ACP methyl ester carboxylesterase
VLIFKENSHVEFHDEAIIIARMSQYLHYRETGQGEKTLVILHGLLGSGANWLPQAELFAEKGYRVLLPDARNHGQSFHDPQHDAHSMSDDLFGLLDHLGIDEVDLIGHSMGGMTAMECALRAPRRVSRLAVLDFAPRPTPSSNLQVLSCMRDLSLAGKSRRDVVDSLKQEIPDAQLVLFITTNLSRSGRDGSLNWRVNLPALLDFSSMMEFWEPPADLRFSQPALFLAAEQSPYITPDDSTRIRYFFPEASIQVISGAGHWLHVDQPARVNEALLSFLTASQSNLPT